MRTLIDVFLEEQASTTAVQRFAQRHADATEHMLQRFYSDLLPASPPAPGQQYAFDVDLDACSGCKACVTACGALNGLEASEHWRDVGALVGTADRAVTQAVTTACHHCVDPGCLSGCPVDAYEKDPVTGIVRHLDDQCIGCRYCTLTCPYEVPQYSTDLGIVRKCDMCHDRLTEGEAPACVQACPTRAIAIRVVDVEEFAAGRAFPFAAPDASHTAPTTNYRTTRDLRTGVDPANLRAVRPSHAHVPLTAMLVLTQAAVGGFSVLTALEARGVLEGSARSDGAIASMLLAVVALIASVAHLGRPHLAWRAVLGLRHSWLSREIIAFSAFAALGVGAAAQHLGLVSPTIPELSAAASAVGVGAVLSSAMVYAVTGRRLWRASRTVARFLVTSLAAGGALAVVAIAASAARAPTAVGPSDGGPVVAGVLRGSQVATAVALVAVVVGAAMDMGLLRHARRGPSDAMGRTALLLRGPLRGAVQARVVLGAVGACLLVVASSTIADRQSGPELAFAVLALCAIIGAELVQRWWFFTAEADLRMPGGRA